MSYQLISILLSFVIFTSYLTYVSIKYGVQSSISNSYYVLPKNRQWLFTIVFLSFSFPLIIAGETGLMFLACAAICFTGTAPNFKESTMEHRVHVISAVVGILAAIAALIFSFSIVETYIGLSALLIASLIKLTLKRKYIWWIEVVAYYSVQIALLHNAINI